MPRVVNNITRAETIQLDLGIGDARAWSGSIHCGSPPAYR